jgi:hypothetical protein
MAAVRRKERVILIPTAEDLSAYTGAHTPKLWRSLPLDWVCPSCRRSRYELLTWTRTRTDSARRLHGEYHWLVAIHPHHDHRSDDGRHVSRFPRTPICGDCNTAEGRTVKRMGLTGKFSFSPEELSRFISGRPHAGVVADFVLAKAVYDEIP